MKPTVPSVLAALFLLMGLAPAGRADRVELADGSVVQGRLVSIEGGKLKVETRFAGVITIAQAEVTALATEEPLNINRADGTTALARLDGTPATPADIAAAWRQGAESPAGRLSREMAEKARRKWSFEASVAASGRTGVREKFNAAFGFKATLASSRDRLILSLAAERANDRGVTTADRDFGGVDYSVFFSPDYGWYVRTSLEKDQIRSIDLRSNTAFGFSRKLVRKGPLDLQFRFGASYLYEQYASNADFDSPGLDLAFLSTYSFEKARLNSTLTYTPAFEEFSNYRLRHEASLELPLTAALWKLKVGMTNEYLSRPKGNTEKLDTTYLTSLILSWR
ncbi:DUF481 domain-containing protein [Lacunisphaera limnophila]|nr:DUF481 domain-containing protein [Lacunisphaera limnophila]